MEVRGEELLLRVDDAGARYPIVVDPFVQQAKLTASDGAIFDNFGWSVAVSGDTVVVGAKGADIGANANRGAAYVFVKPGSGWTTTATFTAKLTASDGAEDDEFGFSVAVSGDTVVVGALFADVGGKTDRGAAYVFVKPIGGWTTTSTFTAKLTASDGAAGDQFGFSVAVSGDTVVVGAPFGDGPNTDQGATYVFVKPGGGWSNMTDTAKLTASDGVTGDLFGFSVAISGDTVVVGAPLADIGANDDNRGAAYVFVKPGSGWTTTATFTAKLTASDGAAFDEFGSSVAVSGDTVVVGAAFADIGANEDQGVAYVFVTAQCGNGVLDSGEVCDDGNTVDGDCCSSDCQNLASTGTVCRPAAGDCDVAENCTGTSAHCPADQFLPSSTVCRTTAGPCDVAETCDGVSSACPVNGFATSGTPCTDDGDPCTVDSCDGSGTCIHTFTDTDDDGVCDAVENGAPNDGDGNGDGTPDSQQSNVTSLLNAANGGYMTLETGSGCEHKAVAAVNPATLNPGDFRLPFGALSFTLECDLATVRIYYHDVPALEDPPYRYLKRGPTPPGFTNSVLYFLLEGAPNFVDFGSTTVGGNSVGVVRFQLVDGQLGDDTAVDGRIVDQGGPALPSPATTPVASPAGLAVAAGALLALGLWRLRRSGEDGAAE
jgi:cysteine-rich repeat protein